MAHDAEELGRQLPPGSLWAWGFTAVGRLNGSTWGVLGPEIHGGWKEIVALRGADCEAGTVAAALWMAKRAVRLACIHRLLLLTDVPGWLQVECGVRPEDVKQPAPPADDPAAKPADEAEGNAKDKTGEANKGEEEEGDDPQGENTKGKPRRGKRARKTTRLVNMDQFGGSPTLKKPTPDNGSPVDSDATCEDSGDADMEVDGRTGDSAPSPRGGSHFQSGEHHILL